MTKAIIPITERGNYLLRSYLQVYILNFSKKLSHKKMKTYYY